MKYAILALGLLLGACSGGGGNSGGGGSGVPSPSPGQWVTYGGNEPPVNQGATPSWNFPLCQGATNGCSTLAGYFYTQLPTPPQVGQTLTINYTVTEGPGVLGGNPVWQNNPSGGDSGAPTLHLFLWRRGDDLSCTNGSGGTGGGNGGFADYRLFAGRTPLVPGANQTISIPLTNASWTNCWASPPQNIGDELNNLVGAGVTFGGQNFAGHGIYLSNGSATFTVNSFSVK